MGDLTPVIEGPVKFRDGKKASQKKSFKRVKKKYSFLLTPLYKFRERKMSSFHMFQFAMLNQGLFSLSF